MNKRNAEFKAKVEEFRALTHERMANLKELDVPSAMQAVWLDAFESAGLAPLLGRKASSIEKSIWTGRWVLLPG